MCVQTFVALISAVINEINVFHQITAVFKLSLLVAFMLISILINCSFIPAAHVCIASVTIIVTCSASIVVVVPEFGYQALESKLPFDSCYRPSRDFRLAPPFPLIVE